MSTSYLLGKRDGRCPKQEIFLAVLQNIEITWTWEHNLDITEEHRDHAGCNLAYGTFIGSNDGKGKKKKSLCQLMNKQVPGRLENEFCSKNKERKRDLEIFSGAQPQHPVIYLLIFKLTWQQVLKWKWCWVPWQICSNAYFLNLLVENIYI